MTGGTRHESHQEGQIPVQDVIRQLDRLLEQNRADEAETHLEAWLERAAEMGDWRARLTILNELMGFHRSSGKKEKGLSASAEGIRLVRDHGMERTVTGGTTFLNAATTMKAFGVTEEALPYYGEAERIFNRLLEPGDYRFAGLYNNLALAWTDMGQYEKAESYYRRAMAVLKELPGSEMELAVTWVNLACLYEKKETDLSRREERTGDCLNRALACLDGPDCKRDGYYAFTCTKCAPTFGHFGYFLAERELKRRAEAIYGGIRHEQHEGA